MSHEQFWARDADDAADPDAAVFLCGAYRLAGDVGRGLIQALPPMLVIRPAPHDQVHDVVSLISRELSDPTPGQQTVLDRLLDVLLVMGMRASFAQSATAPRWYRAASDPRLGRALQAMHDEPERAGPCRSLHTSARCLVRRSPATSNVRSASRRCSTLPTGGSRWLATTCWPASSPWNRSPIAPATAHPTRSRRHSADTSGYPPVAGGMKQQPSGQKQQPKRRCPSSIPRRRGDHAPGRRGNAPGRRRSGGALRARDPRQFRCAAHDSTLIASTWSWVTYTVVVPSRSCSWFKAARIDTRSLASRFDSGSSIRNATGSRTIAQPIATRCRCPPDSAAACHVKSPFLRATARLRLLA